MNTKNKEILDELEEIVEKNRDAVKGYSKAAENTDDAALKSYFQRKSAERREFNDSLVREIKGAYPDFDEKGSFTGSVHRAWMDVKALFSADDAESMLEESIRGDKAALAEYEDVIQDENLPMGLRNVLIAQRDHIQADLSQNRTLEDLR